MLTDSILYSQAAMGYQIDSSPEETGGGKFSSEPLYSLHRLTSFTLNRDILTLTARSL